MAVLRTLAAVVIMVALAEGSLQQPPRDGRPLRQTSAALVTQAHEHYQAQQWARAVDKYEAALANDPAQFDAWFFLANGYDNLYSSSRAGAPANDEYLRKAIQHYQTAADRHTDPQMRKRALQFIVAAYGPEKLNDPSKAEPILQRLIREDPTGVAYYFSLSKLYEDGGIHDEAEETLLKAKAVAPWDVAVYTALSGFYNRIGEFEKTMTALHRAAELEPRNPKPHQRVAVFYWEKAFRDPRLTPEKKREYIAAGIDATDRALAIAPGYIDALTYKNILLRMQANGHPDPVIREALIAEADALRARAIELGTPRKPVRPPVP